MSQSVVVIGSKGFIGGRIVESLKANPQFKVTAVDRSIVELTDKSAVLKVLPELCQDADVVITASVLRLKTDTEDIFDKNVAMIQNITAALQKSRPRSIIFLSSVDVYGIPPKGHIVSEQTPCTPISFYGKSKVACEKHLLENFFCPVTIFRLPGIYDSQKLSNSLITQVTNKIRNSEPIPITGEGKQKRDFVLIDDLTPIIEDFLLRPRACIANIASGRSYPLINVVEKIALVEKKKPHIEFLPPSFRDFDMEFDVSYLNEVVPGKIPRDLYTVLTPIIARVGLGTANIGSAYGYNQNPSLSHATTEQAEGSRLLQAALDNGIRFFDTARAYGNSEAILGRYLKETSVRDAEVLTKFVLSKAESDLELSLKNVGPWMSHLLCHNFNPQTDQTPFLEIAKKLKSLFPHIRLGVSTYGSEAALAAVQIPEISVIEIEYNFLNPHALKAIADKARKTGKTVVLRSLLQRGFLTSSFFNSNVAIQHKGARDSELISLKLELAELSKAWGLSMERIALSYAVQSTTREILLLGASESSELISNLSDVSLPILSASQIATLEIFPKKYDIDLFDLRKWS